MRKLTLWVFVLSALISCKQRQTLAEQLHVSFSNHLAQADAMAVLDSIHILWNVPVTERLGRIIDDSIYIREYSRVKAQLAGARQKGNKDSIEFYQYEIGYMEREIDSISKSIGQGDTTHSFGHLIGCAYFLRKNDKKKVDSTLLFIDSTNTMRYMEFMDSALRRTARLLN